MSRMIMLILLTAMLLDGCIDTGYNQPVYIISENEGEEDQAKEGEEEMR